MPYSNRRDNRDAQAEGPEMIEKVVYLNRVSKTVKATAWARLRKCPKPS